MTISQIDAEERKTLERLCAAIATMYAPLYHNAHVILKSALTSPASPAIEGVWQPIPMTTKRIQMIWNGVVGTLSLPTAPQTTAEAADTVSRFKATHFLILPKAPRVSPEEGNP